MSTVRLTALAVKTPVMEEILGWGGTGARSLYEVKQSSESRESNTSALHRNVLEPSRTNSQLCRFGEMSFTQIAMFLRTEVCLLLESGITLLETPVVSPLSIVGSVSDLRTYGDLRIPDSKPEALPTE